MIAWFFLLVTMTWQGSITTSYIGPFPSLESCRSMREMTAIRVMQQQWVETATMEQCLLQTPN